MDTANSYWEESSNVPRVKYENFNAKDDARIKNEEYLYSSCQTNLNFSTANCSEDDYSEYGVYKNKNKITRQDPKSHRIIEKRRRDRMNNCLADLSRLIPPEYLKKGRGRVEKTEIIEMAIKHMKYLQQDQISPCERYRLGYQECMSETMRFMVEVEGHFPREGLCMRLLNHLQKHCEVIRRSPQVEIIDADEERHLSEYKCRNGSGDLSPNDYRDTLNKSHQDSADLRGVGQSRLLPSAVLNNTSDSDIYHMEPNGYKYKTNIKLRFSQDLVIGQQTKRPCPEVSARRSSVNSSENQISTHTSPMTSELLPPSSEHASDSGYLPLHRIIRPPNFPVPVFALHAKGSFYVPLTVDYHALLPFLRLHQCDLMLDALPASSSLVLHPVTISVDFRPRGCASEGGSSGFEGSNGSEGKCKTECGGWR